MTARSPLLLSIYAAATAGARLATRLLLARRLKAGKEDGARIGERRGNASQSRPAGALVWLHGASVGELISLLPLVEAITKRGLNVLVTSGTLSSAKIAAQRLPSGAQ